jgi:alpha-ribazole phosphatase
MRHAQPCIAPGVCYGALDMAAEAEASCQAAEALAAVLPPCGSPMPV